jgi:hypothetical protein
MKIFLSLTAITEGFIGIALITIPNRIVLFLLGEPTIGTRGMITAMFTGVAILSLAVICWLLRDTSGHQKLIKGMLFYNCAIISVALYGVLRFGLTGLGLWLMILSHAGLSLWGAATLNAK